MRGLGKKDVSDHSLCGSLCEEAITLIGVNSKNLISGKSCIHSNDCCCGPDKLKQFIPDQNLDNLDGHFE